jgi:chromosome partitioning protein
MARIIAVVNQKGGVGKTTTTVNLGHALALMGKKVTLLDLDPQGHLAACLGIFRQPQKGLGDVMRGQAEYQDVVIESRELLQVVPAGPALGELETLAEGAAHKARMLSATLQNAFSDRDLVLVDCPPSASLLVINALFAAEEALIPVTGDYLGLNGLAHLMMTIKKVQGFRKRPIKFWLMLSRYLPRRRITREVEGKLLQHFPGHVLATPVREASSLAECPGIGRTIFEYKPKCSAARDVMSLAEDLLYGRIQQ